MAVPKHNADLLAETEKALLEAIKNAAGAEKVPDRLRNLAEAYALVAGNAQTRPSRP